MGQARRDPLNAIRPDSEAVLYESEARTRAILEAAVDAIITIDEHGIIESWNQAATRMFGFPEEEALGQNVKILMPEPFRAAHDGYIANYLGTGHAKIIGIEREVVGKRKDGSTFPMELAVSEFRIGAERFFTGIARDITERKRVEEALREADRQKDEFLAMVSHELRNPLAALAAAAQVLRATTQSDATIGSAAGVIERQTRQMTRLIEDLIDVTRVRMGKITLEREPLDLAELVNGVVSAWREARRLEGRAPVRMETSPAWLEGDRARLEQIVSNLLDNALKFTPAAGRIDVTVKRESDLAVLRVADSGRGIDPHALLRIFGSFIQGGQTDTPGERGLGLGLAVVQRLTELHGGSVSAASDGLCRGATFTVCFPAVEARDESSAFRVVDAARDERPGRESP
jgi:PAS domain S-box-containing protein